MPDVPVLSSLMSLDRTEPIPTRTINVEVPESIYWHVRKCATESRLSMKEYMTRLCGEAWDYPLELQASLQSEEQPGMPQKSRTLNVEVPESVYWHVRKCATESQQSLKGYMAIFCQEAGIYAPDPSQTEQLQEHVDVDEG